MKKYEVVYRFSVFERFIVEANNAQEAEKKAGVKAEDYANNLPKRSPHHDSCEEFNVESVTLEED